MSDQPHAAPHHGEQEQGADAPHHRPHVVILGGGFAGVECARELSDVDVDVTLVDRHPYNTFQPLLYQVATAALNPGDVTYFLRALNFRQRNLIFRHAEVEDIDTEARQVRLSFGEPLHYDYLVVATGVTTNYFGIPGAEEHAYALYTRNQALRLRDHMWTTLESAAALGGDGEVNFVIVGGGATGVEMAGSLGELREQVLARIYPELDVRRVKVVLVEMGPTLLAPFAPKLQRYTADALRKRGVELRLDTAVKEVHDDCVVLDNGDKLASGITVWASGIKAPDVVDHWGLPQGKAGRIQTDGDLRVQGYDDVFAVGDIGLSPDQLPQLAQPALQGGKHAARQIAHLVAGEQTEDFSYLDKGTMATIGRSAAVAEVPFGLKFTGFPAWALWLVIHVFFLLGYRNRLATITNLGIRYLTWRRSFNAIVGEVEVPQGGGSVGPAEHPAADDG